MCGSISREGLLEHLRAVDVNEGLNFREVRIETAAVVPTTFLKRLGVDRLELRPASATEERCSKVEVSLVLDLSSATNSSKRVQNLRPAGIEFIDTLFSCAELGQVSVVPHTGKVDPGPLLSALCNVTPRIPQSHRAGIHPSAHSSMGLSTVTPLVGSGHFDPWHTTADPRMFFCPTHPGGRGEIVPFSGAPAFLGAHLSQLMADGNTSVEIAVKSGRRCSTRARAP